MGGGDGFTTVQRKQTSKSKKEVDGATQQQEQDRFRPKKKSSVFEELEQAYMEKEVKKPAARDLETTYGGGAFAGLPIDADPFETKTALPPVPDRATRYGTSSQQRNGPTPPAARKPKAKKQPRAARQETSRAPAPSIESVSEKLDLQAFQQFLSSMTEKHASDTVMALQVATDYLQQVFAKCEMTLADSSTACLDTPISSIPQALNNALEGFVLDGPFDWEGMEAFLTTLLHACFEPLPDRGNGPAGPVTITKQVGSWIMLAVFIRMAPNVLLAVAPTLLRSPRTFTSPGRLLPLLWCFQQAGVSNAAAPLGAWLRVVLPLLLQQPLAAPLSNKAASALVLGSEPPFPRGGAGGLPPLEEECRAPAMAFLASSLLGPTRLKADEKVYAAAKLGVCMEGRAGGRQLAVPPEVLDSLLRGLYLPSCASPAPEALQKQLKAIYPIVKLVWQRQPSSRSEGEGGPDPDAPGPFLPAIPLILDTAAAAMCEPDEGARAFVLEKAAHNMVACLHWEDDSQAFDTWSHKHKTHLLGSAGVLSTAAAAPSRILGPILQWKPLKAHFLAMLPTLKQRHKPLLKDKAARATARLAETSVTQLEADAPHVGYQHHTVAGGCVKLGFILAGLFVALLALAATKRASTQLLVARMLGADVARPMFERVLDPVNEMIASSKVAEFLRASSVVVMAKARQAEVGLRSLLGAGEL